MYFVSGRWTGGMSWGLVIWGASCPLISNRGTNGGVRPPPQSSMTGILYVQFAATEAVAEVKYTEM